MTVIRPEADTRITEIANLDHPIPCGYSQHPTGGRLSDPATWAVWFCEPFCGHHPCDFVYFCSPCWDYRNSVGWVRCRVCLRKAPALSDVLRIERIRNNP